jgi:DNA-binding PadR family transcriptional regulator
MFDPDDPHSQLFVTRVFQSLANINTRKIVELLAQGPRSTAELLQVIDSTDRRIKDAMQILQTVGLVSGGEDALGKVYLLNPAGLDRVKSWLDRIESIVDRRDPKEK